jgi:hypothetical protein
MIVSVIYPPMASLPDGPKSIPPQVIDEMIAAQRAKRQEELNRGFLVPLKTTVFLNLSIMERYERLHNEITFKGKVYVKSYIVISDDQPYVQYVRKGIECPERGLVSRVHVPHLAILAEYLFGITHAGLDSYLAEFGKFIGVHLDANNMPDYLHAFSAYICKEMEVDPRMVKLVVKYVMHLK